MGGQIGADVITIEAPAGRVERGLHHRPFGRGQLGRQAVGAVAGVAGVGVAGRHGILGVGQPGPVVAGELGELGTRHPQSEAQQLGFGVGLRDRYQDAHLLQRQASGREGAGDVRQIPEPGGHGHERVGRRGGEPELPGDPGRGALDPLVRPPGLARDVAGEQLHEPGVGRVEVPGEAPELGLERLALGVAGRAPSLQLLRGELVGGPLDGLGSLHLGSSL